MPLSKITIEFSKNNQKSLKVISIGKLKQDLPEIDQFLTKDRASFCLFPDAPIALASPPSDNEIIWGGAMGIQAPTIDNPELINPAVFAIHL